MSAVRATRTSLREAADCLVSSRRALCSERRWKSGWRSRKIEGSGGRPSWEDSEGEESVEGSSVHVEASWLGGRSNLSDARCGVRR